ncbi:unnamed protein product [Echinostoma caproni]|uniref:rRNA adenine N(6)-methyltransferase n=1 Tax=Echinostoma caproni TaxID=27848 RepID=A0A3P8H785_9TREM|nr:unnamed protein product [Echinostoma caproni]
MREVLRIYGLRAQKQLAQNFLLQPASLNGFVKRAGSLRDAYVLEVGPGPGGLTRAILSCRPKHLAVVELDRRFIPGLEELRLAAFEMGIQMDIYRSWKTGLPNLVDYSQRDILVMQIQLVSAYTRLFRPTNFRLMTTISCWKKPITECLCCEP